MQFLFEASRSNAWWVGWVVHAMSMVVLVLVLEEPSAARRRCKNSRHAASADKSSHWQATEKQVHIHE